MNDVAGFSAKFPRGSGLFLPLLLALLVIFSALAVVRVKHENRLLTMDIERLRVARERIDMEWAQLQLEEAALAHHGRIEELARGSLGMSEPRDYQIVAEPKKP